MTEVAVTLLFTDLVDSTAIGRRLQPADAEALRQTHFSILRTAINATGGAEVKNLGDGLMVAFTSPSRALACAVTIQQQVDRHNRRAEVALSIRIGLACGEAIEEKGDYFGDPVVEAARLCARAEGGQILATDAVRMMAGRNRPAEMTSVGELELKGIPDPVAAVEVRWEPAASDASLPLPSRLGARSASGVFAFTGRADELARLDEIRKRAATDGLQIALVSGEPGMGKSSLAAEAARRAHDAGDAVLFGACPETAGAPYQPWIAAFMHLVEHADGEIIAGLRPVHAARLRALLPAARDRIPAGEEVDADPDTERYLLLEAVVELLALASVQQPVIVVLDDLHWADAATLGVVRHLVTASAALRVTVIATYRDSDLTRGHPLSSLLAELSRQPFATRIALAGLGDVEVVELMESAAGYAMPAEGVDLAHALRRETAGNPFFTVELLRHLAETGALQVAAGGRYQLTAGVAELTLPSSVREVVADRVVRLGDDVLDALSAAAVIGQEFDLDLLARITGRSEDELIAVLERATAAALINESTDAPGCYRFVHALTANTLAHDLGATRRQRAHQRIAEVLESRGADAAVLATHWMAATQPTDVAKAIAAARQAGHDAFEALAPDDALRWYRQALALLDRDREPDPREHCRVLLDIGRAGCAAQDPDFWQPIMEAGRIARALDDDELIVEVALTRGQGEESVLFADPERVATIELALQAVVGDGDTAERAQLLAALAEELGPDDWARRTALGEEAIAIARRLVDRGDPRTLPSVIGHAYNSVSLPNRLEQRRFDLDLAFELAEQQRDAVARFTVCTYQFGLSIERGDGAELRAHLADLRSMWEGTGLPYMEYLVRQYECTVELLDGDLGACEEHITRAFELGATATQAAAAASFGAQMANLRLQQGRISDALEQLEPVARSNPNLPVLRVALTFLYCQAGRLDEARELFAHDVANGFADFPFDTAWMSSITRAAQVAVALDDRVAAAELFERIAPFSGQAASSMVVIPGAVDYFLGNLAATLSRYDDADRYFASALELHERLGGAYLTALTQLDWADLLRRRGQSSDTERAARLTASASVSAAAHGFDGLARRSVARS